MSDTLTLDEIIVIREAIRSLDSGVHQCRYCSASSPYWAHSRSCPYIRSVKIAEQARVILDRIQGVAPTNALEQRAADLSKALAEPKAEKPKDWACLTCGHAHYFEADEAGFDGGDDIPWGACKTCDCKVPNYTKALAEGEK